MSNQAGNLRETLKKDIKLLANHLRMKVEEKQAPIGQKDVSSYQWSMTTQALNAQIMPCMNRLIDVIDQHELYPDPWACSDSAQPESQGNPLEHLYAVVCRVRHQLAFGADSESYQDSCERTVSLSKNDLIQKAQAAHEYIHQFTRELLQEYRRRRDQGWRPAARSPNPQPVQPCWKQAYEQFLEAQVLLNREDANQSTDKEAYHALKKRGDVLPDQGTWSRYLRRYRSAQGLSKRGRRLPPGAGPTLQQSKEP